MGSATLKPPWSRSASCARKYLRRGAVFSVCSLLATVAAAHDPMELSNQAEYSLQVFQREKAAQVDQLKRLYHGNWDRVVPWQAKSGAESYLWEFFPPAYNCPWRERIGRFGEGGKVVCNWQALARTPERGNCHVLTVGVRTDANFEKELHNKTGCALFSIDPSTASLPRRMWCGRTGEYCPGLRFKSVGLSGPAAERRMDSSHASWRLYTLDQVVEMAGWSQERIDIFKLDCEGCEVSSWLKACENETALARKAEPPSSCIFVCDPPAPPFSRHQ